MSTNPRDAIEYLAPVQATFLKVNQADVYAEADKHPVAIVKRGVRTHVLMSAEAYAILSALQPAVSEEAVEAALRALMSARGEMLSTPKAEMFRDAIAAPNSQVWSYLLRAAITAALPFMMGERT